MRAILEHVAWMLAQFQAYLLIQIQVVTFCVLHQVHYRPQLSWGKVIFSEVCVKNSVHREGACVAGGMHGKGGACVAGGHVWWGACMAGGVRGRGGGMRGIWSMSGRYVSYGNAFLLYWRLQQTS